MSWYFIELKLVNTSYITRHVFYYFIPGWCEEDECTVEQEKKFYYEKYLPKYEWVYMHRTSRIEYTW